MGDLIARGMSVVNSKKEAMKIAVLHVDHVESTPDGMGIRWVMSDTTTYFDLPLTELNIVYRSELSDATNSTSSTTPATSKAICDTKTALIAQIDGVVTELNNYIKIANKSDSITANDSSNVATSKAVYDINQAKIDKTDISTTLANNSSKVAALSLLYELNEKFGNYILNSKISQDKTSVLTTTVPSSYALSEAIKDLDGDFVPVSDITDDSSGSSKSLVLSQYGGRLIKDLISSAISGVKYMGGIGSTGFNALEVWNSGDLYRATEEIVFKTVTIPNKALIIFKTNYIEGTALATTDFDYFASTFEVSHTVNEVDEAVSMTLDADLNKLGWVDIDNCLMYCDESTRTVHVKPKVADTSTYCYINAVKIKIDADKTIQFPDTTGTYYIVMSEAGVLSYESSYNYNTYTVMPIAFIRWNAATQKLNAIFDLRVHGLDMPVSTRAYLYNLGTQWQSGFDVYNFGLGTNADASIAKLSLTEGVIRLSEKLLTYKNNATPTLEYENKFNPLECKIYYIDGTTYTNIDPSDICFKMGTTYPCYNKNTDGVFTVEESSNDKYINMFIGVSSDIRAGESAIAIMGQGEYNTIDDCKKEKLNVTSVGDLRHKQFHFMYRVIVHISDNYTNSYHAKLVEYEDIRDYTLLKTFADANSGTGTESLKKVDVTTSSAITAIPNTCYYLSTGCKDAVITLPKTGVSEQDQIVFQEVDGVLSDLNIVTISGTNATINGSAETFIINRPYVTVTFEWTGTTWLLKVNGTLIKPDYVEPIRFPQSTLSLASGNLPIGVTTSSPNVGDIWNDGTPKFQRDANFAVSMIPDVGDIKMTARLTAPFGWLICDGSAISRTNYSALFNAIGTSFGSGDGSSTFNIPDFRSRMPLGAGQGTVDINFNSTDVNVSTDIITISNGNSLYTGTPVILTATGTVPTGLTSGTTYYVIKVSDTTIKLATTAVNAVANTSINITAQGSGTNVLTMSYSNRTLGEIGGQEKHNQTESELVKHSHVYTRHNGTEWCSTFAGETESCCDEPTIDPNTSVTGGSQPFNLMNPYVTINYLIKY